MSADDALEAWQTFRITPEEIAAAQAKMAAGARFAEPRLAGNPARFGGQTQDINPAAIVAAQYQRREDIVPGIPGSVAQGLDILGPQALQHMRNLEQGSTHPGDVFGALPPTAMGGMARAALAGEGAEVGVFGARGSGFWNPSQQEVRLFWKNVDRHGGNMQKVAEIEGVTPATIRARLDSPIWKRPVDMGAAPDPRSNPLFLPRGRLDNPLPEDVTRFWAAFDRVRGNEIGGRQAAKAMGIDYDSMNRRMSNPKWRRIEPAQPPAPQPTPRDVIGKKTPASPVSRQQEAAKAYQQLLSAGISEDVARSVVRKEFGMTFKATAPPLMPTPSDVNTRGDDALMVM